MKIIIENFSNAPIYQQIYDQIKEGIIKQERQEGDKIPSIRELSRELKVSVITTTRAYTELEKDGYISIIQGKGCFVNAINNNFIEESILKEAEENASNAIKSLRVLKKSNEEIIEIFKILLEE